MSTATISKSAALRHLRTAINSGLSVNDILTEVVKNTVPRRGIVKRSVQDLSSLHGKDITKLIVITVSRSGESSFVDLDRKSAREGVARLVGAEREDDLSPTEAAEILGFSRTHVRYLMDEGVIKFYTVGSHHRITRAEVERVKEDIAQRVAGVAEISEISEQFDT